MPPELLIFVGLQGSGKTTFFSQRFAATHVLVSKDRLRNNRNRERRQQQLVREALAEGKSVVVDNTNVTAADRTALVSVGREAGAAIVAYNFTSGLEDCLERNRTRTGLARVPEGIVAAASRRLQAPTADEGFDAIVNVHLRPDGTFEVTGKPGVAGRKAPK